MLRPFRSHRQEEIAVVVDDQWAIVLLKLRPFKVDGFGPEDLQGMQVITVQLQAVVFLLVQ